MLYNTYVNALPPPKTLPPHIEEAVSPWALCLGHSVLTNATT